MTWGQPWPEEVEKDRHDAALNEIQDRHDAAREVERNLLELHQVFLDMAVVVETQGEKLDNMAVVVETTP